MRTAFVETLTDLMRKHRDIVTLTPDMGFSVFEGIQKEFPKRFFNTGVTEQSTISLAAGMAMSGFKVFVYAQAIFMTLRCLEQVRLDVAYEKANVKIIGTAGGFWLNQLGVSHFSLEDIGAMRLLPNMTILTPGDPYEAQWATRKAFAIDGPVYVRLAKPDRTFVHTKPLSLTAGGIFQISRGDRGALLVAGNLLSMAIEVKQQLARFGIHISIYSIPMIKPMNKSTLRVIMKKHTHLFTLEEHSIVGGLGSVISEYITDSHISGVRLYRFGVPDEFIHVTGTREFLLEYSGLSPLNLVSKIRLAMK
jgi:transketolase